MITQKIETMAETGDPDELHFKSKAITAFFPYAIWQEKDGDPTMLDAFMRASWASGLLYFTWHRADRFVSALLSEATPRAIVLSSPHIPWYLLTDRGDLVGLWAAATSAIPYTEEVAQCVVDTLLQIASRSKLLPYITPDIWAWLTTRPSLPPVCVGRYYGTYGHVAEAIRKLEDVDILKSYMLLAWSEWDALWNEGFDQICASIRGDFGGAGMDRHWVELIQRLDHVLGELAQGLGHLQKRNPILRAYDFQLMDDQYKRLRETLLEANMEAITGGSLLTVAFFRILTLIETRRIPRNFHVLASSPVIIILYLAAPGLPHFICTRTSISTLTRRTSHHSYPLLIISAKLALSFRLLLWVDVRDPLRRFRSLLSFWAFGILFYFPRVFLSLHIVPRQRQHFGLDNIFHSVRSPAGIRILINPVPSHSDFHPLNWYPSGPG